jgi:hypothetical protein
MKKLISLLCLVFASYYSFAQAVNITGFDIRENPYEQNQISIVATDSLHNTQEAVNGNFVFTVNGFEDTLKFVSGVAFYKHKIDRSTFLYARHVNETNTPSALYYVYKSEYKLIPIHISWIVLVIIPLALILLAYMFKRFIIVAVIIFIIFVYFNYHNNLSIPTFFQSIVDGIRHAL